MSSVPLALEKHGGKEQAEDLLNQLSCDGSGCLFLRKGCERAGVEDPGLPFCSYLMLVATTFVIRPKMNLLSCSLA